MDVGVDESGQPQRLVGGDAVYERLDGRSLTVQPVQGLVGRQAVGLTQHHISLCLMSLSTLISSLAHLMSVTKGMACSMAMRRVI